MDYEANDNPSETPEMEGRYPEPIPAEQGEERLKASEVHLRAVQRACEILDAIPFNKSIADLRWAGRRLYIECKRLAARPQPKEPQAEASREAPPEYEPSMAAKQLARALDINDGKKWPMIIDEWAQDHALNYLVWASARPAPTDEKRVLMGRAHELKYEIREALRDLGLESVDAKGVADKTLDALEELEALAVTGSAKEEGR